MTQTVVLDSERATTTIQYRKGDVFSHETTSPLIIPHICNDVGGWGAGFVLAISRLDPRPEEYYRRWFRAADTFGLGETQFVPMTNLQKDGRRVIIANMIGQHGIGYSNGVPPIRYEALRKALTVVTDYAIRIGGEIAAPKFGAGLAGGDWNKIESIIKETLCAAGIPVTIYSF